MKTLDQIVGQLLRTESLAARSRWLILGAIAIWLAASTLALAGRDPGHFSRAGAVGTGLVLATFAVSTAARQTYQTLLTKGLILVLRQNLRDREGRPLMLPGVAPEPQDVAAHDYDQNLEAIGRLLSRLDRRAAPARTAEVGLAAVSTLQWGYGDLLVNRLLGCGQWTC